MRAEVSRIELELIVRNLSNLYMTIASNFVTIIEEKIDEELYLFIFIYFYILNVKNE